MRPARLCSLLQALPIALALTASPSSALVIYRFGGEALPPPPEAADAGTQFVQLAWTGVDPAAGGMAEDVEVTAAAIRALRRDPSINIAPTALEREGRYFNAPVNGMIWDGDAGTAWSAEPYLCAAFAVGGNQTCISDFGTIGTANIDLGGLFQLDRIRVISGLRDPGRTVRSLRLYLDQEMPLSTVFDWAVPPFTPWLLDVRDNRDQYLDIPIPPHAEVGFVQVTLGEHVEDWEVNEVEVYARGYVKKSTYVSKVLDFGRPMAWGELRWAGSKGERARVVIQTRSGADADPVTYFRYTGRGEERQQVEAAVYGQLKPGEKAGTGYDQEHWTYWSAYEFGDSLGTQVVSLSPRRFLQLKVDLLPRDEDGGEVRYLELRASAPVATALVGEVWPVAARTGEWTSFRYVLRPTIGSGDPGFDRLEIQSLSILGGVQGVRIGDVAVPYALEAEGPHRLVVSFARLQAKDSGALVEVGFEAQVLRYGATFEARVADSALPLEVPQGVTSGDATGEYEGNRVSVSTVGSEPVLLRSRVGPAVLTPNGDGHNDEAQVEYEILEITGSASVRVEVWDLAGRRVRRLHAGAEGTGSYRRSWDGRDDGGRLLPPGIYLCRFGLVTDTEQTEETRILHLVY